MGSIFVRTSYSLFEVTTPVDSADNVLLTLEEAKASLGVTDTSRDTDITRLVARASGAIFKACKVREDGINPPTLLSEDILETLRLECRKTGPIILSRRRVSEILAVTEAGVELSEDDFEIDRASGGLMRLSGDAPACWPNGKISIEYTAGFSTVPEDLKMMCEMTIRTLWRDAYQTPSAVIDPALKVDDIPGVRRIERFVSSTMTTDASILPPEVQSMLNDNGYIEIWVA